jgi:esterase/lipase superfamily enzyme
MMFRFPCCTLSRALSVLLLLLPAAPVAAQDETVSVSQVLRLLNSARNQAEKAAQSADEAETSAQRLHKLAADKIESGDRSPATQEIHAEAERLRKAAKEQLDQAESLTKQATLQSEKIMGPDAAGPQAQLVEAREQAAMLLRSAVSLTESATRTSLETTQLSNRFFDVGPKTDRASKTSPPSSEEVDKPTHYDRAIAEYAEALSLEQGDTTLVLAAAQASGLACVEEATCTPVPVFFGTDRAAQEGLNRLFFTAARTDKLTLGKAVVTVPRAHRKKGEVNRPSWWDLIHFRNPWREDPTVHFTVPDGGVSVFATPEAFVAAAKEHMDEGGEFKDHVFVFVHGYNVEFDDALFRAAQISFDLGDGDKPFGTAFLYSWPSKGAMLDYGYDADSARLATEHLGSFLQLVMENTGAKNVHLIAHSMGNRPLVNMLKDMAAKHSGDKRINEIILAAPDIDAGEFPKLVAQIGAIARGVTLYASSNDRAMLASRTVHGSALRAGDVSNLGPVVVAGIDSIDVSAINTDFLALNHSTYADTKELLDDIWRLMRTGQRPPDKRNLHLQVKGQAGKQFWQYAQ